MAQPPASAAQGSWSQCQWVPVAERGRVSPQGSPEPPAKRVRSRPHAAQPVGTWVTEQPGMGLSPPRAFPAPQPPRVSSDTPPPMTSPLPPVTTQAAVFPPVEPAGTGEGGRGRGRGLWGVCGAAMPVPLRGAWPRAPAGHRKPRGEAELGKGVGAGTPGGEGEPLPQTGIAGAPRLPCRRAGCGGWVPRGICPIHPGGWVRARSPAGTHVTSCHPRTGGQHHSPHPAPGPTASPDPKPEPPPTLGTRCPSGGFGPSASPWPHPAPAAAGSGIGPLRGRGCRG